MYSSRLERGHLFVSSSLPAGNYCSRMTHSPSRWRSLAADKSDDWFADVIADKISSLFFGSSADLPDHDDGGGVAVLFEQSQHVNKSGPNDRIAAYADGR